MSSTMTHMSTVWVIERYSDEDGWRALLPFCSENQAKRQIRYILKDNGNLRIAEYDRVRVSP